MAFNTLEYLRDGKVDFIYNLTINDQEHLIKSVRKSQDRVNIINGFLPKLKEEFPSFCIEIIYDIPEFASEAYELLDIKKITPQMLSNLLNNTPLGIKILYENFDVFISSNVDQEYFNKIVKYAFDSNNIELINILSRYQDLHIRYLFMDYLIQNHPNQIDLIYDDITKYTTSITYKPYEQLTLLPQLMNPNDISKLAVLLLTHNRKNDYKKLKNYILKEYKYNYIASELLTNELNIDPYTLILLEDPNKRIKEIEFNKDADKLFETSMNYKYTIYLKHKEKISDYLLNDFLNKIKYYLEKENKLAKTYLCGLGNTLEEWTSKYMDLSKNKEYGFIAEGSTSTCFRIGDYVIKLIEFKWSYEDIICPNIYLINKNYEEIYLRSNLGIVTGGLEVQKYLTKKSNTIDPIYFSYFDLELDKLGYKRTDTLINGSCGDNTMILDSYYDADTKNPEKLPNWFKNYPLVIIDRDRVYKKDEVNIKQLRSGY